jgi:hypothetical protein
MSLNLSRTFGPAGVLASSPWNRAAKHLSFRTQRYARNGLLLPFEQMATFSRPLSPAERLNIAGDGLLAQTPPNVPRIDSRGYLPEAAAVGQPVNLELAGLSPGTPGTMPNGLINALPAGISREILASQTTNGVLYLVVRFFGTATTAEPLMNIITTNVATVPGARWTASGFMQLLSGTIPGNLSLTSRENNSGTFVGWSVADHPSPNQIRRLHGTRTIASGNQVQIDFRTDPMSVGVTYDATCLIGGHMLNEGELTSPIRTANAGAITRAGDVLNVPINDIGTGADWTLCGVARMPTTPDNISEALFNFASGSDLNNRFFFRRNAAPSFSFGSVGAGTSDSRAIPTPSAGAVFGWSMCRSGPQLLASINGGAPVSFSPTVMPTANTQLWVGCNALGTGQFNAEIAEVLQFYGAANDATMQTYSTPSTWGVI